MKGIRCKRSSMTGGSGTQVGDLGTIFEILKISMAARQKKPNEKMKTYR